MKTLTLNYLPESITRKDTWLMNLIKQRVYITMGEIRHGRIKLVDGALEMLYGDNTGPLVTVEVHDDRFYTSLAAGGAVWRFRGLPSSLVDL